MKRIRAAFLVGQMSEAWLGGLNYFRNLFAALEDWPERPVDPVLIVGRKNGGKDYREFPRLEVITSSCLDRLHPAWFLRKSVLRVFGRDLVLNAVLAKSRIGFLSHLRAADALSPVPAASWLPDFQHVHCPAFFTPAAWRQRDEWFRQTIRFSQAVILSSHDAEKDLAAFDPEAVKKSHVLHFVANPPSVENALPPGTLAEKYQISGPYFHLPNQFWAHKNHLVVVQALKILKQRGTSVQVLATGRTDDARQPEYFGNLTREVREAGVEAEFRVLGLIPYPDLIALMRNAAAVLNPSFFEGWSSSVEEGKSLGKRMIISDLAVHREQDPPAALYFNPKDPAELAVRMAGVLSDAGLDETALRERARLEFPGRRRQFARDYCAMVEKILAA